MRSWEVPKNQESNTHCTEEFHKMRQALVCGLQYKKGHRPPGRLWPPAGGRGPRRTPGCLWVNGNLCCRHSLPVARAKGRVNALQLDAPTSAEKRWARCGPGLDVLERGEADRLEGGTSETAGRAIWAGQGA